jgi:hypothetical protein
MKTRIIIEINSENFVEFKDSDKGDYSKDVERDLHEAVASVIETYLHSDQF